MKYDINYNPVRKLWTVWRIHKFGAEIVKAFKTEAAARRWVERQG